MKATFFKGVALGSAVSLVTLAATAAFAGTGVGNVFNLGASNRVNVRTQLQGTAPSALLNVSNENKSGTASGVSIDVRPTNPPLVVNSKTKVKNLNADLLDGRDASKFQGSTAKSCPTGTAIGSIAPGGGATCSSPVVLPIEANLAAASNVGFTPYLPSSLGLGYECITAASFAAVLVKNVGSAPATVDYDQINDAMTPATTDEVLVPGNDLDIRSGSVTLSQIEYFDQTTVTTIDISIHYLGADGCEFRGTVQIAQR
jgi:hypothetical protein